MPDPFDAPRAARRPRCPRCRAGLGRLAATVNDVTDDVCPTPPTDHALDGTAWYCGCCGLVLPSGALPAAGAGGARA